jgi:hypothetical protein
MKKIMVLLLVAAAVGAGAAEFLGADKFYRPRETVIFYLNDRSGGGFDLKIDCRDMNTYLEGARPAYAFLLDQTGKVVDRKMIEDDGIVKNDPLYKDGVSDIFMDFRYREYHRVNSPGGNPPGKKRSPFLTNPGLLAPKSIVISAPPGSVKGVYKLIIAGSWDHWYSVTPSRKLEAGIHPGQCGIYLHGSQFKEGYLYLPKDTKDLAVAISEEVKPYNWEIKTSLGTLNAGSGFLNYMVIKNATGDKIIKIEATGSTAGAMLHIKGVPSIICESEAAAEAFGKAPGYPEISLLKNAAAKYPKFDKTFKKLINFGPAMGFDDYGDMAQVINEKENPWIFRSNWWSFGDGWMTYPENPEPEIKTAINALLEKWALARYTMEVGMCTNQWGKITEQLAEMYHFSNNPVIREVVEYNTKRMCTKYSLGRVNPDKDTYKSGYEADSGYIDCGIMAEALGHDNEYNLETDSHLVGVYKYIPVPEIITYLSDYYRLKTHLTLPKTGNMPKDCFSGTCSPSDSNFRTRYYTHKASVIAGKIDYGSLWDGSNDKNAIWPCMETAPFTRVLDGRYAFINTGKYYAVIYLGYSFPVWQQWMMQKFDGNSLSLTGYVGAGYGGWQYFPAKPGGISAIWIPGSGPALLANNHNVMYSNLLWGVTDELIATKSANVDAGITAEGAGQYAVTFDPAKRLYIRKGTLPRTPLSFERKVTYGDAQIDVEIVISSSGKAKLNELYEALPIFAQDRNLIVDGQNITFPPAQITPSHAIEKKSDKIIKFSGSNIKLFSANGAGIEFELDKSYEMTLSPPLKYRDVAATMSGISLKLPQEWENGTTYTLKYRIKIHSAK